MASTHISMRHAILITAYTDFNEGKIIDATFVEAPKQRNTKEENKQIKTGNSK